MKKLSFCLICLSLIFIFSGCFDPVFSNIRKEVPLESSTVSGFVNSIVRFSEGGKNYIVTQNGESVFYNKKEYTELSDLERVGEESAWKARANETFESEKFDYYNEQDHIGEYIIKISADRSYLYVMTAVMKVDHSYGETVIAERKLYCTDSITGTTWNLVDTASISSGFSLAVGDSSIFCTNTIEPTHRTAYLRNGKDLYQLNGTSKPAAVTKSSARIPECNTSDEKNDAVLNSAVWFNGGPIFFKTLASTTNETSSPATVVYYGASDGIAFSKDGITFDVAKFSGTISCMTVTKNSLLFGEGKPSDSSAGGGGIYKVKLGDDGSVLKSDGSNASRGDFLTNADAVFTSSYQLVTLMSVDPSLDETESLIYASTNFKTAGSSISVSYENLGLWAYYPTRGNWNRE